jgi:hypothetical protein
MPTSHWNIQRTSWKINDTAQQPEEEYPHESSSTHHTIYIYIYIWCIGCWNSHDFTDAKSYKQLNILVFTVSTNSRAPMTQNTCFWFHAKRFNCTLCLVPLQPSLLSTMASFISPQAKGIFVSSYVWNMGSTFHLSTTRYPDQADQSCILHIPGIDGIIRNRESCNDLFHQHIAFTYLLHPTTIIPPVQRTSTKFLPSLDQVGTKRGQQDWHQQQLLWLHWHVRCSVTFSDLWSHHCEGFKKNSCHGFSLWSAGTAERALLSNHVDWSHIGHNVEVPCLV